MLRSAAITLLYFGSALAGNALKFTGNVDAVWPPVGVGMAALYLCGLRYWPAVLVGDLLADWPQTLPFVSSFGQTCGNMLEMALGAVLMHRYLAREAPLETLRGLRRLVPILLVSTGLSAIVGPLSLWAGGVVAAGSVVTVWRTWWLGDATGALVIIPLALAWGRPACKRAWRGARVEALALTATLIVLSEIALSTRQPLAYLVFPALIWAGLRFGPRGATLAVALATALAVWKTAHKVGPFAIHSISAETVDIQLYIAAAALSTLFLTAIIAERRAFEASLAASRSRLIHAAESERRRLERNLHDGAQQRLTALAIHLRSEARHATPGSRADSTIRVAAVELTEAIDEIRDLAHGIHPSTLRTFGLGRAVESIAARATVPVGVEITLPEERLSLVAESTAYYVIAEAIANVQSHAHASEAHVRVQATSSILDVRIDDNGIGGATERSESGLEGLRDRVEGIGGTFALRSPRGGGTTVSARIPLQAAE